MSDERTSAESGDWLVDPFGGPLAIDRDRDGDEWQHRMTALLRERTHGTTFSVYRVDGPPVHVEYALAESDVRSRMWAVPTEGGVYVLVSGSGEATTDQVEPWADAAAQAQRELGNEFAPTSWTAMIGPVDEGMTAGLPKTLADGIQIGPMRMTPSDKQMTEAVTSRTGLHQYSIHVSEPIQVDGVTRGYDWEQVSRRALGELHVVCGLMSIAMDQCWTVRVAPRPSDGGTYDLPSSVVLPGVSADDVWPRATKIQAPNWMDAGYRRAETDRRFRNRVAGFQEAMSARAEHPSLAAVAFVAVIETIGTLMARPEHCPTCRMQTGSGNAFRRALRLVLPVEEAERLDKTYGVRSKTAHEGQLHGDEIRFGAFAGPTFWTVDPTVDFMWGQLRKLQRVARELLELELKGELPPRDAAK